MARAPLMTFAFAFLPAALCLGIDYASTNNEDNNTGGFGGEFTTTEGGGEKQQPLVMGENTNGSGKYLPF